MVKRIGSAHEGTGILARTVVVRAKRIGSAHERLGRPPAARRSAIARLPVSARRSAVADPRVRVGIPLRVEANIRQVLRNAAAWAAPVPSAPVVYGKYNPMEQA